MSTPTTSSSKTPAASTTASAVVASKATTAATSATTATGIASTAMSTSAATESRLSVAGYHSRWHEKHAIRNKTGKIIAVETGVGIYSPGGEGVPLDYGSEVEEGELEGDKDTLSPGHTDLNVGLRRPRGDDSNASGSKRSPSGSGTPLAAAGALTTPRDGDDSAPSAVVAASHTEPVREPWMPSQSEIGSRFGATAPPNLYALYSCNAIVDDDVAKRLHFDPLTNQRRDYYIGLFHELRWFASKKTSRRSKVPEWQALCQSWSAFVENFNKNPAGYRDRISQARERYEKFSKRGKLERLHHGAVGIGLPCAVPYDTACEYCYSGAVRITERDVNGYTSMCVPDDLKTLRASFQAQASSSAADNRSTYSSAVGDYSARPSFTPFGGGGGGGLRTPSPFPECPPSGHSVIPTYRVGEEILSNEYENEPDLGSGSDDQQFAGRSSELPRFAALRQELSLLKAQLAEVAQTTSNVKVEVGMRLSGVSKRVAALESALAGHQT
ncbi:uncharacterized protein KRP23_14477 [Phytophthora ramorum]|uniref:uncharacterized protein n=1 Tax=Phytophthora ramorum TaxID=164328 RepID=UPI00309AD58E|nr:hypothetical protein KRP23_14477 [Phytophthora ramorum]